MEVAACLGTFYQNGIANKNHPKCKDSNDEWRTGMNVSLFCIEILSLGEQRPFPSSHGSLGHCFQDPRRILLALWKSLLLRWRIEAKYLAVKPGV